MVQSGDSLKTNPQRIKANISWSVLIENADTNPLLVNINLALKLYNDAYAKGVHTRMHFSQVIEACETYIKTIPLQKRFGSLKDPHITRVLNIQKKAVSHSFLPEAKTDARARILLLEQLLGKKIVKAPDEYKLPGLVSKAKAAPGKMLMKDYWKELRYGGKEFIADWVEGNEKDEKLNARSYGELTSPVYEKANALKCSKYLDSKQQTQCKVDLLNGVIYVGNTKLTTSNACIFVLGADYSLYVFDPKNNAAPDAKFFHHTSFTCGQPVLCAGNIEVNDGKIIKISDRSGHYKPTRPEISTFLNFLEKHNVDLSQVMVTTFADFQVKVVTAKQYGV